MENKIDPKILAEARKQLAQSGGKTTLKKYGRDHFKRLSEKAIKAKRKTAKLLVDKER